MKTDLVRLEHTHVILALLRQRQRGRGPGGQRQEDRGQAILEASISKKS